MPAPTLVIVNPNSASGATRARWREIARALRASALGAFDTVMTDAPGHATLQAGDAAGYRTVICVGGDGTINEVVNGLMQIAPGESAAQRPVLGVIPSGSGSDFARALALPQKFDQAAQMLAAGGARAVDVGALAYMRGRALTTSFFINIAGLGFDADVCHALVPKPGTPNSYLLAVLAGVRHYRNRRIRLTTTLAGSTQAQDYDSAMVAFCNGRYFGGGMHLAPNANMRDGLFDVVVFDRMSRLDFLLNFPKVYRGTHLSHPKFRVLRASEARVELVDATDSLPMRLEAEGQLLGEAPVSVRMLPGALRVLAGAA